MFMHNLRCDKMQKYEICTWIVACFGSEKKQCNLQLSKRWVHFFVSYCIYFVASKILHEYITLHNPSIHIFVGTFWHILVVIFQMGASDGPGGSTGYMFSPDMAISMFAYEKYNRFICAHLNMQIYRHFDWIELLM